MKRIVACTGSRDGMTSEQKETATCFLSTLVSKYPPPTLLIIHGDCCGVDTEFDEICESLEIDRGIYPSTDPKTRRHAEKRGATELQAPKRPYARNKDIAAACQVLIAFPRQDHEIVRSGTWHTVRSARELQKKIFIVWPDGRISPDEQKEGSK